MKDSDVNGMIMGLGAAILMFIALALVNRIMGRKVN